MIFQNFKKDEDMNEEMIKEIFDVELVRLWRTDEEGNAIEKEVEIEVPEIEVNIFGDAQDWWVEGASGIVETGSCR